MRAILRDSATGVWRLFERPTELVVAREIGEVQPALRKIEAACAAGSFAAGFVAYEAAAAFDSALQTHSGDAFPLLWFGLYAGFHELPVATIDDMSTPPDLPEEWQASVDRETYERVFETLQELIRDGDTYQVNLTYRLRSRTSSSPWGMFQHLANAQQTPYGAYLHAGEWVICSASPELFFEWTPLTTDGRRRAKVISKPMKGTAGRGLWFEQDVECGERLRTSSKERAENVMIVDMVRNDLGRIALPGTVTVTKLFDVERYPTVWQMTSTVEAETEASLTDTFAALFPAASITGAPKARTMEIIKDVESTPRRIYTGSIGFIEPGCRAQFNVAIRTVLMNRKTGLAEYGVGGGIVIDSSAAQEWAETTVKARVLAARAPGFDLLETILWKPKEGFQLLDRHLTRLMNSAAYFCFDVDAQEVRDALDKKAERFGQEPQRVRLTVSRRGAIDIVAQPLRPQDFAFNPIELAREPIDIANPFLYHKTTHRSFYRDDTLMVNRRREITETSIANVVVEFDDGMFTPPVACGLLPGTARAQHLEDGRVRERVITVEDLARARRVLLVNSVRGLHPVDLQFRERPHGLVSTSPTQNSENPSKI